VVTLTASPASGSSFSGWSGGGCSGTGTCTVTMGADQAVTASFAANPHTLTVSLVGSGSGSVTDNDGQIDCPGTCSHSYAAGSTVILYAVAAAGSTFSGWSGAGCEGTAFCVVNMDTAHTVTATFTTIPPSTLTVRTWGSGSGSVTSGDGGINCPVTCSASYAYDTQVTLTATAASGSTFVGWSGGGCSGSGMCVVMTDSPQDVTASFEKAPVASETPGRYSGFTGGGSVANVSFYVSPNGGSIEDVDIHNAAPSCTPSGSVSPAYLGIASIPINSDGSFSSTTTQTGLVGNVPATFTYTFTGHFHGPTGGLARVDGIWREDVTYANSGTSYNCTTNNQSFYAPLDGSQSNQNTATASPGSYSGFTEGGSVANISFDVSSDSATIENVSIPSTSLACSPVEPNLSSHITFASIPINTDGSFTYDESQSGIVNGEPATITYTSNGHVHGPNSSGNTRINGIWREDVTYANSGTSYYCSTNNQSYAAVHQ
jgi:hypothetical protein